MATMPRIFAIKIPNIQKAHAGELLFGFHEGLSTDFMKVYQYNSFVKLFSIISYTSSIEKVIAYKLYYSIELEREQ